ncbi:MAG: hypothetical protein QX195_01605 [Methylococcaceae bacterium]
MTKLPKNILQNDSSAKALVSASAVDNTFSPVLVSSYDTTGTAYGVAISGNKAYVADYAGGLQIFDISNPTQLSWLGNYGAVKGADNLIVIGNTVYVANTYAGMAILNVSNPAKPSLLGSIDLNFSRQIAAVAVSGNTAYLLDYQHDGLDAIDISNPAKPSLLGSYHLPTGNQPRNVTVEGDTAYVASGTAGLRVFDVSNPTPVLLNTFDKAAFNEAIGNSSTYVTDVAVKDHIAYVTESNSGSLTLFDVSNPTSLRVLSSYKTGGYAYSVTLSGTTAYVANSNNGVVAVDVSDPSSPALLSSYQTTGANVNDIAVKGHYAYVANGADGLQVIQMSENTLPTGNITISGTLSQGQILTANNTLVDADGLGLITYQWLANGKVIGTGNTFQLTRNEVGKAISVTASYTDQNDTLETVNSTATALVQAHTNTAPSFNVGDGKLTTNFDPNNGSGGYSDDAQSVALQADGKILVAGLTVWNNLGLVRYNIDGSLDSSFGAAGFATGDKSMMDYTRANSVVPQSDGKILVAGSSGEYEYFSVERFLSNGKLDVNFATDGKVTTEDLSRAGAQSLTLQMDGKLLVGGHALNRQGGYEFALARYDTNGYLDLSFGTDGKLTDAGGFQAYSVAVQSDGKLLLAGNTYLLVGDTTYSHNKHFALTRYNADGSPDLSFGTAGKVTADFGFGEDEARSVVVQPDGKILLGGTSSNGHDSDFTLVRYNTDGSLDSSFHFDGKLTSHISVGGYDNVYSVILQPDGKIVAAGGSAGDFALARYTADGSWDTSFGDNGKVTTDFGTLWDSAHSLVLQPDGKLLVAGQTGSNETSNFALARYNTDGSLDASFHVQNTLDNAPSFTEAGAAVVLDDNVQIYDAELSATGNYAGASVSLNRSGLANPQDVFSAKTGGTLGVLDQGGNLLVDNTAIGTIVSNSGGVLTLNFNSNATQSLVNTALQHIAYSNISTTPPATAKIDWTFNDGNSSTQGSGGAFSVIGSTTVKITDIPNGPTATDKTVILNEDSVYTFSIADFGYVDVAGLAMASLTITRLPDAGLLKFSGKPVVLNQSLDASQLNKLSFTPVAEANGSAYASFDFTVSDGQAASTIPNVITLSVTAVNDAPNFTALAGAISNGIEDKVVTVTFTDLLAQSNATDKDGAIAGFAIPSLSSGNLIIGSNAATATAWDSQNNATIDSHNNGYWTPAANVNGIVPALTVLAKDEGGLLSSKPVVANIQLASVNDPVTGDVIILGTANQGETLTASNTLSDADGVGVIRYTWQTGSTVLGTGNAYTLTPTDVGKTLTLIASYTDLQGHTESKSSVPTSAILPASSAGFAIKANDLFTGEDTDTAVISISLATAPTRDVTLNISSSDLSEGTIANPKLIFSPNNWSTPQILTVVGVNDYLNDGNQPYILNAKISSNDVNYRQLHFDPITLSNREDLTTTADPRLPIGTPRDMPIKLYGDVQVDTSIIVDGFYKPVSTFPANDILNGLDGNDIIYGKDLEDDLSGGIGNDTLYGGNDQDFLYGQDGNDLLYGEQDADYLDGGVGNDSLDGGLGLDTLIGGSGNDTYYLGYDVLDVIKDNGVSSDIDTVIMPYQLPKYTLPRGIEIGTIASGTAASSLTGNDSNNVLTGNDGNNTLNGQTGNDSLVGGSGNDSLEGGTGNDTVTAGEGNDLLIGGNGLGDDVYVGGLGNDTVKYTSAISSITVDLSKHTASGNEIGNDNLVGIENIIAGQAGDSVLGDAANNSLDGYKGNDSLNGSAGNDILIGGLGADRLTGGTGADRFKFNTEAETGITATTYDTITDFSHTQGDKLDISAIDANTGMAGNSSFALPTSGGTFSGSFANPGDLYLDQSAHILYGNNDADSSADFAILLLAINSLSASDLIL